MMNFRFHLVSLVAVFLSLAIGIVIGSTVVDRAIVENLRDRIDDVEARADATHAENRDLRAELDDMEEFVADAAPFTVAGRLTAVPVVMVAERAAPPRVVEDTVVHLRQAGARVPAILWIEPGWSLEDAAARIALRRVVRGPGDVETLRAEGVRALGARIGEPLPGEPDLADEVGPTLPDGEGPAAGTPGDPGPGAGAPRADVLQILREAGLVSVEVLGALDADDLEAWPAADARVVVVVAPADGEDDATPGPVGVDVAVAIDAAGRPTLLGEAHERRDEGPPRGEVLAPVRRDDGLRTRIATVDSLDLQRGRVAAVLALEDLGRRVVGHYGRGLGAGRELPAWAGP